MSPRSSCVSCRRARPWARSRWGRPWTRCSSAGAAPRAGCSLLSCRPAELARARHWGASRSPRARCLPACCFGVAGLFCAALSAQAAGAQHAAADRPPAGFGPHVKRPTAAARRHGQGPPPRPIPGRVCPAYPAGIPGQNRAQTWLIKHGLGRDCLVAGTVLALSIRWRPHEGALPARGSRQSPVPFHPHPQHCPGNSFSRLHALCAEQRAAACGAIQHGKRGSICLP